MAYRKSYQSTPAPCVLPSRLRSGDVSSHEVAAEEWDMRLFVAALTLLAVTTPAGAQWLDRKTAGLPRTADGKPNLTAPAPRGPDGKPDLTGVWNGPNVVARPDVDALQPWVRDLVVQRQE